jgi:putative peptidoglycan lipid II flippase
MSTDKSISHHSHKSIAKSASIISIATLCSRLLGFFRDMLIARLFGVYTYAQAFVVAFKIPNLLRDSIGEGAANAALVPVFSEYTVKHSKEEFWHLANILLNIALIILMAVTILGILFSPILVRIMAPGFIAVPEKLAITISLNRLIFPYILLVSLAAYAMAILNSLKHFIIPAFAPCLLNISIIVCALLWGEGIKGLASGVLIGGVLQLLVQIPMLYKKGFRFKFVSNLSHPAVSLVGKLMLPRIFSSCIYQLNNLVDSIFGSLAWIVGEGGVAVLYFSYRLIQFPLGIFSNALSQAILPTFSTQALEDNHEKLKITLSWGLRSNFFVMLPASTGFVVLAYPIVKTLFGGGRFDLVSQQLTATALLFYSIGLFAYGATKILQSCFFALKDTRTPAKVAFLAFIINVSLNSLFMFPLKIGGIALATSISGISTFCILLNILKKNKFQDFNLREIALSFLRIFLASVAMGLVCYLVYGSSLISNNIIKLTVSIASGIISYIFFCFIFRVSEVYELLRWIRK